MIVCLFRCFLSIAALSNHSIDCVSCLGKLTDDITEFVESWQENPPQGQPTWDNSFLNEPPCLTQSHESLQVWILMKGLLP